MSDGLTSAPRDGSARAVDLGIDGLGPATPIARGGSSVVYRAKQYEFGRDVAVKLFAPDADPRRIDNERRLLGAVTADSGAVTVLDGGVTRHGESYLLFPVFERGSLHQLVQRQGPLSVETAGFVLQPIADALADLHAAGIVHRDLKPGNILLTDRFRPRLTDFGVASDVGVRGEFAFTPGFAAPEARSCAGAAPTAAFTLDVFGFAATAWFTLTGDPPPVDAAATRTSMPDPIRALLLRCLHSDPDERPVDGSALAGELRRALRLSTSDTDGDPEGAERLQSSTTAAAAGEFLARWWWVLALVTGAALLAFGQT